MAKRHPEYDAEKRQVEVNSAIEALVEASLTQAELISIFNSKDEQERRRLRDLVNEKNMEKTRLLYREREKACIEDILAELDKNKGRGEARFGNNPHLNDARFDDPQYDDGSLGSPQLESSIRDLYLYANNAREITPFREPGKGESIRSYLSELKDYIDHIPPPVELNADEQKVVDLYQQIDHAVKTTQGEHPVNINMPFSAS